jgi:hypothetical protein
MAARVHRFEANPSHAPGANRQKRGRSWPGFESVFCLVTASLVDPGGVVLAARHTAPRETEDEADPSATRVGERYYFLEITEAPAYPLGHACHLRVTLKGR